MAGKHRAPRRGVVKQLSNLAIDEVSLVDRGANQHASVEITKALTADDLLDFSRPEDVEKGKGSSFGRGGDTAGVDEITNSEDPSGLTKDIAAEDGETQEGPGETGETVPPGNGKKEKSGKVGKSAGFWTNFVSKVLAETDDEDEFTTDAEDDDTIEKHFPGAGAQNPMQSPFPGSMGPNQPPVMQSVGANFGLGQPQGPMAGQPGMQQQAPQMPQLPPEVVQYIQQLEAALDAANGGSDQADDEGNDDVASDKNDDKKNPFGKSGDFEMTDATFLSELAKSLDDEDQLEYVHKALEAVSKAEERAVEAEKIAKAERDLRLEREFVTKAAEFNVPVKAEELGPVLKRASELLAKDDLEVLVKCLRGVSAEQTIFAEVGKRGGGSNGSILDEVEVRAHELVTKNADMTSEMATAQVLEMNPRAYEEYLSSQRTR